jgi:hypothetical protein
LGEQIDFFVDDDPYRHNLESPVFQIPVLSPKNLIDQKPAYCLVMAPLYADPIIEKNQAYLDNGGTFIKFWPKYEVVKK